MSDWTELIAIWLADFFLLSTLLVASALVLLATLKQPVQRLAIAKATMIALVMLGLLCAVPGWSVVHPIEQNAAIGRPLTVVSEQLPSERIEVQTSEGISQPVVAERPIHISPVEPMAEPWLVRHWSIVVVGLFGFSSAAVVLWLVAGVIAARRLRQTARPAPAGLVAMLADIVGERCGQAELMISDRVPMAVAIGAWRPAVLLPASWAATETPDQLRGVLAHVWAHVGQAICAGYCSAACC